MEGCKWGVSEDSKISIAPGVTRRAGDMRPGDILQSTGGYLARIELVIEQKNVPPIHLLRIGELVVNSWTPIRLPSGEWGMPVQHPAVQLLPVTTAATRLLGFVLEDRTSRRTLSFFADGVECAAFAHGVSTDTMLWHFYQASETFVHDMYANMQRKVK